MAMHRLSFIFEYGKAGWSEQWYREAESALAATVFTPAQARNFMKIRSNGVVCRAIRANDVAQPRVSYLNTVNWTGEALGRNDVLLGDPAQVALLGYVVGASQSRRPLLLRGMIDSNTERDITGRPVWNANFLTCIDAYVRFLTDTGMRIRVLDGPNVGNPDRPVTAFSPGTNNFNVTVAQYTGLGIPQGSRVIFHGIDRNLFPGLTGPVPTLPAGADAIAIPVMWRSPAPSVPGVNARVRAVSFAYQLVQTVIPQDVRSKKVGRPSLLSRGRRQAMRFRSR